MSEEQLPIATRKSTDLRQAVAGLLDVWPTLLDDVLLPLEEDRHGIYHDIRREVRCASPARIVEVSAAALVAGRGCCQECVPRTLEPGGRIYAEMSRQTLCMQVALDPAVTPSERACAAVLTIWNGASRYLPRQVFDRLRVGHLLPLLSELAPVLRSSSDSRGPLVAFTAGDMRLGGSENPQLYAAIARAAAGSLVYVSPCDGVWLLHDPYQGVSSSVPTNPPLGRVLATGLVRAEIDLAACEVFGVLADDALSGASSWEDIHEWWAAAQRLND